MLLKKFSARHRSASPKRFELLRNFSIVSLSAFILATGLLSLLYRQRAVRDLATLTERNNDILAQVLSNKLWPQYGPFLSRTQALSDEDLAAHPRSQQLYEDVITQLEGSPVAKVKIFDLQGRTIFSTDVSQLGDDKSQSTGFLVARSGQIVSQLGHRDTFKALQSTLEDHHLLSSYIPIRTNGSGDVVGVFELYTDVTPSLELINRSQRETILISLLILALLYSILFLFVRRAENLLKQQYQQLEDSEGRYRQQARELEQTLDKLQQTQMQMLQSEKMSSLGQLVAGIAHEVNNPVNFIRGNLFHVQEYTQNLLKLLQLYQQRYPNPIAEIQAETEAIELGYIRKDLPKTLSSMEMGSNRIREIVQSLRNFSRLDEAKVKAVDIHEGLESTLIILNHRLKAQSDRAEIQVIRDYANLPKIECYPGLLNQVFMNVIANGVDALEEAMKTQTHQNGRDNPSQITLRTSLTNDQWLQVVISDNGPGIPSETQQRIFDPFFTTKPVGKGTGMGMAISYQIVTEKHGGKLECFSTLGMGTEFVIQIPVRQMMSSSSSSVNHSSHHDAVQSTECLEAQTRFVPRDNSVDILPISSLSNEGLIEVCMAAEVIACECPGYLARLLKQVRAFRDYTTSCIEKFPEDKETHLWLAEQAKKAEDTIYQTMIELMRKENLIDESSDSILLDKISERARRIIAQQLGNEKL
ncbi:MAG: ATP-binding protein [Cyanobacteria bacterium J06639_16]